MERPKLYINLGFPDSIHKHKSKPIDGVGLLRLEFMIATYVGKHPASLIENGKRDHYIKKICSGISTVASEIYPKPVIVRFSDFKTNEYHDLPGGAGYELAENNPMMGWRGASRFVSDKFNPVFRAEVQSLIRARENHDNVWAMIPFVRSVEETRQCLNIMKEEGLGRSKSFKLWLMAETPAVALLIDEFNKLDIDGYSIGSNDLCQFVLAVDRDNANLSSYFDEEDPAVIKAIEMIVKGAKKSGKTCSICGDSVSNSLTMVDKVLDLGIDSLSLSVDTFEQVKKHVDSIIPVAI